MTHKESSLDSTLTSIDDINTSYSSISESPALAPYSVLQIRFHPQPSTYYVGAFATLRGVGLWAMRVLSVHPFLKADHMGRSKPGKAAAGRTLSLAMIATATATPDGDIAAQTAMEVLWAVWHPLPPWHLARSGCTRKARSSYSVRGWYCTRRSYPTYLACSRHAVLVRRFRYHRAKKGVNLIDLS